jgi:hypothetical protein
MNDSIYICDICKFEISNLHHMKHCITILDSIKIQNIDNFKPVMTFCLSNYTAVIIVMLKKNTDEIEKILFGVSEHTEKILEEFNSIYSLNNDYKIIIKCQEVLIKKLESLKYDLIIQDNKYWKDLIKENSKLHVETYEVKYSSNESKFTRALYCKLENNKIKYNNNNGEYLEI